MYIIDFRLFTTPSSHFSVCTSFSCLLSSHLNPSHRRDERRGQGKDTRNEASGIKEMRHHRFGAVTLKRQLNMTCGQLHHQLCVTPPLCIMGAKKTYARYTTPRPSSQLLQKASFLLEMCLEIETSFKIAHWD